MPQIKNTPRYSVTHPVTTKWSAGQSDTNLLKSLFRTDPLYSSGVPVAVSDGSASGQMDTYENLLAYAQKVLAPSHQKGDLGMFPIGVDLNYAGVDKFGDPNAGAQSDGIAGSSVMGWSPNPSPPGEGNGVEADKILGLSNEDVELVAPAVKRNKQLNPSLTSEQISSLQLNVIQVPGEHPGSSKNPQQ